MKKRARDLVVGDRIVVTVGRKATEATVIRRPIGPDMRRGWRFDARTTEGIAIRVICDDGDAFDVLPKTNDGGMTRAEGRRQRKEIGKQIAADLRAKARAKVRELRAALTKAKAERKTASASAAATCAKARAILAARRKDRRARLLAELREVSAQEIAAAKARCGAGRAAARAPADRDVAAARAALEAERTYQRSLARIEAGNKARRSERAGAKGGRAAAEKRAESDDEVRSNLPPELVPLFERVARKIKASTRQSRTEAFLTYAEEHPDEVIAAQEDGADAVIRDLEARMAKADAFAKKRRYTAAELAEVPF